MINELFTIPFFPQRVDGWAEKKERLMKYISEDDLDRNELETFSSDRRNDGLTYIKPFCDIFREELNEFGKAAGLRKLEVTSIWMIRYDRGDFHPVHNHKSTGFSGILYLDYDAAEHTPSVYVSPMNDPVTDCTMFKTPEVQEGDLIIFPSSILHYCAPSASDVPRRIVSFDMNVA